MSYFHIYNAASAMRQMGQSDEEIQIFISSAKHHVQWKKENPELLPFEVIQDDNGKEFIVSADYISLLRYDKHLKNKLD